MTKQIKPIIIIDTREQHPYAFPEYETVRKKLRAGDYSIGNHEHLIAIERKELDDFVHTLIRQRERFNRELCVLELYDYAAIVVEGGIVDIVKHRYKSNTNPHSILKLASSIEITRHIPIHFAEDRQHARLWTENMLLTYWELVNKSK